MGRHEEGEARGVIAWSRRDDSGSLVVDPKVEALCRAKCVAEGFDPEEKVKISEKFTKGKNTLDYHTIYMRGWQMYVDEVEAELKAPATVSALTTDYPWTEYTLGPGGSKTKLVMPHHIDPWGSIEGDYNVKPTSK